jgi:hypothetical protein
VDSFTAAPIALMNGFSLDELPVAFFIIPE